MNTIRKIIEHYLKYKKQQKRKAFWKNYFKNGGKFE